MSESSHLYVVPSPGEAPLLLPEQIPQFAAVVVDPVARSVANSAVLDNYWKRSARIVPDPLYKYEFYEDVYEQFGVPSPMKSFDDYLQRQAVRFAMNVLYDRASKEHSRYLGITTLAVSNG